MNRNPLISVIIPTFNRAGILPNAINSLLAQTYTNVEIIIVDDGSTDNTSEILQQYKNIKYIYKENGGQGSARNEGLKHATGELIASLDSDDEWYPLFLERCVRKMVDDELDFVFANWDQQDPDGRLWDFLTGDPFLALYMHKLKNGWVELNDAELRSLYIQACPSPSSSFVTKKQLVSSGWSTKMKIGDDWYLYLDIILSGKRKAAFTIDRLWRKKVTDMNVYDGRKRSEVLEYLYIADTAQILNDFKHKLTPEEYKLMQKKHVYGMVELAKHHLIRNFDLVQSTKLLGKSLTLDASHTLWSIQNVIAIGYKRNRQALKKEKNSSGIIANENS